MKRLTPGSQASWKAGLGWAEGVRPSSVICGSLFPLAEHASLGTEASHTEVWTLPGSRRPDLDRGGLRLRPQGLAVSSADREDMICLF